MRRTTVPQPSARAARYVLGILLAGGTVVSLFVADQSDCVIISPYGTVLYDPVVGEDTGEVYCPTGETSGY